MKKLKRKHALIFKIVLFCISIGVIEIPINFPLSKLEITGWVMGGCILFNIVLFTSYKFLNCPNCHTGIHLPAINLSKPEKYCPRCGYLIEWE